MVPNVLAAAILFFSLGRTCYIKWRSKKKNCATRFRRLTSLAGGGGVPKQGFYPLILEIFAFLDLCLNKKILNPDPRIAGQETSGQQSEKVKKIQIAPVLSILVGFQFRSKRMHG